MSLAASVEALPDVRTVNTLLIGSGVGNLDTEVAVHALLGGLLDALADQGGGASIRKVRIVERDWKRSRKILRALIALKSDAALNGLTALQISDTIVEGDGGSLGDDLALSAVVVAAARLAASGRGSTASKLGAALLREIPVESGLRDECRLLLESLNVKRPMAFLDASAALDLGRQQQAKGSGRTPTRFSFMGEASGVRAAAISESAVVQERTVPFDWALVRELVARLSDPVDLAPIDDLTELLARLLVPRDFRSMLVDAPGVILEIDRRTASIQWERSGGSATRMDPESRVIQESLWHLKSLLRASCAPLTVRLRHAPPRLA